MIIYNNALGQCVSLNKHNYLSPCCYAQFELAMMDKMPATVVGMHFIEFSSIVKMSYFEFINKTNNPEKAIFPILPFMVNGLGSASGCTYC